MWSHEYTVDCPLSADAVWAVYADAAAWPDWNPTVEQLEIDGPFAAGAAGKLTPRGQEPLNFVVISATPARGYVSETAIADTVTLRTENTLEPRDDGGTRIVSRLSMHGPAAEFFGTSFGPAFAASVPATLQAVIERAADGKAQRGCPPREPNDDR